MELTGAQSERVMVALAENKIEELDKIMLEAAKTHFLSMESPLHIACALGQEKIVSAYLNAGMDVNSVQHYNNTNQSTPLLTAVYSGNASLVNLLLATEGIKVNAKNPEGQSAFHVACAENKLELAKLILSHAEVDINCVDLESETPLITALSRGHTNIVDYLLSPAVSDKKIDVNVRDGNGSTALMIAITALFPHKEENIRLKHVVSLIERKADVHAISKNGKHTALALAREKNFSSIVAFLEPLVDNKTSYNPVFIQAQQSNLNTNNNQVKESEPKACCLIL